MMIRIQIYILIKNQKIKMNLHCPTTKSHDKIKENDPRCVTFLTVEHLNDPSAVSEL